MTKQTINVGTTANAKDGDSLRVAFQKVNANFADLYANTYTATTPSSWNGTAPTTVNDAIDRLATLIKSLNSGTGA